MKTYFYRSLVRLGNKLKIFVQNSSSIIFDIHISFIIPYIMIYCTYEKRVEEKDLTLKNDCEYLMYFCSFLSLNTSQENILNAFHQDNKFDLVCVCLRIFLSSDFPKIFQDFSVQI